MTTPRSFAEAAFVRACTLDVAVRKPGNVSRVSPGHGMQAAQFIASAEAAAGPLFRTGARVGERIEAAVQASWAAAGCNTNLGIVLLCAPIAAAWESVQAPGCAVTAAGLHAGLRRVLEGLDVQDAAAAFRAIARANPGGLGEAPQQDVHAPPSMGLREAMALAAGRDRIARQYRDGFDDLFGLALAAWPAALSPMAASDSASTAAAVQALYVTLLAAWPDSHIVRKHGEALAHSVMTAAQGWAPREAARWEADPAFAAWDEALKGARINPGTTADLTVATLLLAALCVPAPALGPAWHGT
ncbi:triphosphoribosyl-dephospho-CoA synthase [Aquincola sp. MAHUQ-54]|uniref:Triphosphoribosyl-dephospho-CoA synthase n=1 Tax=Aquincola agrisoli TaxID=3119538 RepID=A0AAW9Q6X2_9BURK